MGGLGGEGHQSLVCVGRNTFAPSPSWEPLPEFRSLLGVSPCCNHSIDETINGI